MTKIVTIEVIVPDEIKPDDDVFNFMRKNTCRMKVVDCKPNPNDPPITRISKVIRLVYEALGAQDATEIENNINNALISVKGVSEVEFI